MWCLVFGGLWALETVFFNEVKMGRSRIESRASDLILWTEDELKIKETGRLTYCLDSAKVTLFVLLLEVKISSASLTNLTKKYKSFTLDGKFKIKTEILNTTCFRFYDVFKDNKKIYSKKTAQEIHKYTNINLSSVYYLACTGESNSNGYTVIKNINS